jgi:hypothetical protein
MNTILIPNIDNKFFRNIALTQMDGFQIIVENIKGNIYHLYYKHNFNYVIIPESFIDNSILQFAVEYSNKVHSLIEIGNNITNDFMKLYKPVFKFLIHNKYKEKAHPDCTNILCNTELINDQLYPQTNQQYKKIDYISCFLDELEFIPEELSHILYPKTNKKIRMFNNNNIKHTQNLGTINEIEKSVILKESQYYLDINNLYKNEAIVSGCTILTPSTINQTELTQPTNTEALDTYRLILEKICNA